MADESNGRGEPKAVPGDERSDLVEPKEDRDAEDLKRMHIH
jgi:hypothetical protein